MVVGEGGDPGSASAAAATAATSTLSSTRQWLFICIPLRRARLPRTSAPLQRSEDDVEATALYSSLEVLEQNAVHDRDSAVLGHVRNWHGRPLFAGVRLDAQEGVRRTVQPFDDRPGDLRCIRRM